MFRAIADYFFGGAPEEPQSPLETQEVNDWLVVNMADRPQDDIVMIESTKPDPMSDSEYEDILDAVSCLMRPVEEPEPELEPSDGESTEESSEDEDEEEDMEEEEEDEELYSRKEVRYPISSVEQVYRRLYRLEPLLRDPRFLDNLELYSKCHIRFGESLGPATSRCQLTEQEVVQHYETAPREDRTKTFRHFRAVTLEHAQATELMMKHEYEATHKIKELDRPEVHFVHCKVEPEVPNSRFVLPRRYVRMYSHVLDATSRDHTQLHKAEIQQRIQEVEREQKLKKYKTEKVINKGQLNRQNKNYLFQSSCKKNRRRDLQRSHSGANNNRKCSC